MPASLYVARLILLVSFAVIAARDGAAACTGDCDSDQQVSVEEAIEGVAIALGHARLSSCPAFDPNGDDKVAVSELVSAVRYALHGCPTATATASPSTSATSTATPRPIDTPSATPTDTASVTPTNTATPTPCGPTSTETLTPTETPTPTATTNQPPVLPGAPIYRSYPGFDIRVPVGATDPEGGPVFCSATALPAGAAFDEQSGTLSWTPATDQLGPFYVPLSCTDDAVPPLAVDGLLRFRITPLDACAMPSCDEASGCTATLPPVSQTCCDAGPVRRVAEPVSGCPEGRVLYVGQSVRSFGRLQNCDTMQVVNFEQSGAEVRFHVEARCMKTDTRVRLHARLESNSAEHPVVFDVASRQFFLSEAGPNGFARQRNLRFPVEGVGPFFDLQDADANLTLTLTDEDGASVSQQLRVRLSFAPLIDLPDLDPPQSYAAARAPLRYCLV